MDQGINVSANRGLVGGGDCRPARQTYTYSPFLAKLGVVDPKATEERTFNVGVDEVILVMTY